MTRSCARCARPYVWDRLELALRMPEAAVRANVTSWPDGVAIEVRRCPCGACIARKVEGVLARPERAGRGGRSGSGPL